MRISVLARAVTATLFVIAAGVAAAADTDGQRELVRAERLLHQMSQERDAAQAENAKLKNEIDELTRKLGGLKKSSQVSLAKAHDDNAALNQNLQKTAQDLQQTESQKTQLQTTVVNQAHLIESCTDKNVTMVLINRALLRRYANKGCYDALLQREPLTQLERVQIENVVQEYQDQIDQQEFKNTAASAAAH
ncbi:MAG: hypothetical protein ACYC9J_01515 [Sulfuricaulis sp.]